MRKYRLEYQDLKGRWKAADKDCEYIDEVYEMAGLLFDAGIEDFFIKEMEDEEVIDDRPLYPHHLVKVKCPICGKIFRAHEMVMTRDCHGILYRKVCEKCYEIIQGTKGYDGERYTEADECIEEDWWRYGTEN